jgi:chromosome partitioning protein
LGWALARSGLRVALIDLDPQACLSYCLGVVPAPDAPRMESALAGYDELAAVGLELNPNLTLFPAGLELAGWQSAEVGRLAELLADPTGPARRFDLIILDCSPALGWLTLNALVAADELIIPTQAEILGYRAVGQVLDMVADLRSELNPDLLVRGLLPTMFDVRTTHNRAVLSQLGERFDVPVLDPPIPRSVRFADANALGRSILEIAPRSAGAKAYQRLADGLLADWRA